MAWRAACRALNAVVAEDVSLQARTLLLGQEAYLEKRKQREAQKEAPQRDLTSDGDVESNPGPAGKKCRTGNRSGDELQRSQSHPRGGEV